MSVEGEVGADGADTVARVLVVDDHRTFSELLMFALNGEPDFECVGVACSASEAVEAAQRLRPDIVVLDIEMPGQNGLAAARQIRTLLPDTLITVLSAHQEPDWVVRAAQAGVNGYVTKDGSLPDMLDVLRRVRIGTMLTARGVFRQPAAAQPAAGEAAASVSLTDRERDVLGYMGQGLPPKTIARVLGISLHTCRGYVKSIHSKLGVRSQLEAVVRAQRLGILPRPDAP